MIAQNTNFKIILSLGIHVGLLLILSPLVSQMPQTAKQPDFTDYCRVNLALPLKRPKAVNKPTNKEKPTETPQIKRAIAETLPAESVFKESLQLSKQLNPSPAAPIPAADKIDSQPSQEKNIGRGNNEGIAIGQGEVSLARDNFFVAANIGHRTAIREVSSVKTALSPFARKVMRTSSNETAINSGGDDLSAYKEQIFSKILSAKFYPQSARKRGIKGTSVLRFLLAKDGAVKAVDLVESSQSDILDRAAISTIQDAAPFLPFPPGYNQEELWLKLAISFSLE
ncbi:MAG: energy transducer TonB [Candidatus Schekmanbacteria bacterium]|nr:energy transducer TonB [Candidatus Schekmanbacteria bacterium]